MRTHDSLPSVWPISSTATACVRCTTDFEIEESAQRFQRSLLRMGIDERLRRAGVQAGDTVRIGAVELEWEPDLWEAG